MSDGLPFGIFCISPKRKKRGMNNRKTRGEKREGDKEGGKEEAIH